MGYIDPDRRRAPSLAVAAFVPFAMRRLDSWSDAFARSATGVPCHAGSKAVELV